VTNRRVSLVIRGKTSSGWQRFPVAVSKNGKLRAGFALVRGEPVQFDAYQYLLRGYQGSKVVYTPAGTDASDAQTMLQRERRTRTIREEAKTAGIALVEESKDNRGRTPIRQAADAYVKRAGDRQAREAAVVYRAALDQFLEANPAIQYADEIDESAIFRFQATLRKRGNSERTISNKYKHVRGFALWCKIDRSKLGNAPRFEKKLPVVYSRDQVSSLVGSLEPGSYLAVVVDLLRMTGIREREAAHLAWKDVDFQRGVIKVRSSPAFGFQLKDFEQREVPLPAELAKTLKDWRQQKPTTKLVVGGSRDQPHTKWLRLLKRAAKKANLNCNHCLGCEERQECGLWQLHAFRRSYATRLSQSGIDIPTIQRMLGHSDIQTTMRYLAAMHVDNARSLFETVKW
jgi:integrase